jgi:hypothetical protein
MRRAVQGAPRAQILPMLQNQPQRVDRVEPVTDSYYRFCVERTRHAGLRLSSDKVCVLTVSKEEVRVTVRTPQEAVPSQFEKCENRIAGFALLLMQKLDFRTTRAQS